MPRSEEAKLRRQLHGILESYEFERALQKVQQNLAIARALRCIRLGCDRSSRPSDDELLKGCTEYDAKKCFEDVKKNVDTLDKDQLRSAIGHVEAYIGIFDNTHAMKGGKIQYTYPPRDR